MVSHLNILVWKWSKIAAQKKVFFLLILPCWKPRFPMDERPLVEGYIANIGISLDVFEFSRFGWFFPFFKKIWFSGILGPPYCGIVRPFNGLFAPTSRSRMSNIFRDSESLGKSSGKKWSHIWTFLFGSGPKSPREKKFFFFADFALQNMVETTLPDGLETSGRRVYR